MQRQMIVDNLIRKVAFQVSSNGALIERRVWMEARMFIDCFEERTCQIPVPFHTLFYSRDSRR